MGNPFQPILDDNEQVYWTGQPAFIPFLSSGVLFLIIGLAWGAFDYFGFIRHMGSERSPELAFLIPFFALHLFPFYGSILNMFRLVLVYNNTHYAYSNKRLLMKSGFMGTDFKTIDYDKIADLEVNVNPLEQMFGVGTIRAFSGETTSKGRRVTDKFIAISNPYEVFKQIKQVSVDIKTDWSYPNANRPEDNPGYNTQYNPDHQ